MVAQKSDLDRAARVFKVLAHPDRLRIVCSLLGGEETTQKVIIDELGWPQSTVNRHLLALRDAGLVKAERQGTQVLLTLSSSVTLRLLEAVCDWVHPENGTTITPSLISKVR